MTENKWRLLSRRLPVSVKILSYIIVFLYIITPLLLIYYVPRASFNVLERINLPWIMAWTTLQASISATLAVIVGLPIGIAAGYYGSRIARIYRVLGLPIFMAPSVAVVLGFRWLAEQPIIPDSFATAPLGIILVHSYFNIPLSAVLVYSVIAGIPRETIDYLESIGIRGSKLWTTLLLPVSIRGVVSAWLLTFIYSFTGLAAPLMVEGAAYRYYTLEAWIYTIFKGFPSYRMVAVALTILQAAILAVIAYVFLRSQARITAAELGEQTRRPQESKTRLILDAYSLVVLIYLYMPVVGVVLMSLSTVNGYGLENYIRLLGGPLPVPPGVEFGRTVLNSLIYSAIAVAGSLLVSLSLMTERWRGMGNLASVVPLMISPVTIGLSFYLILYTNLRDILGHTPTILLLVGVSHIAMATPLASRAIDSGLSRIPVEVADYISMIDIKGFKLLYVLARAAGPGLVSAAMLAAASSLGEFGAVLVLTEPSTWSLGVLTYNLYGAGRVLGVASASASILLAMTVAIVFLVARNLREWF
ncbi:MAG: ABC transporter permease subunit [Desulfurococcales archaeon]|nr:ABC transporter permease subunit [Desulfurococcales archaeon]